MWKECSSYIIQIQFNFQPLYPGPMPLHLAVFPPVQFQSVESSHGKLKLETAASWSLIKPLLAICRPRCLGYQYRFLFPLNNHKKKAMPVKVLMLWTSIFTNAKTRRLEDLLISKKLEYEKVSSNLACRMEFYMST